MIEEESERKNGVKREDSEKKKEMNGEAVKKNSNIESNRKTDTLESCS